MPNGKPGKRKRQPTLDDLFQRQRQRLFRSDGQGSSTMTDVKGNLREVCIFDDDEADTLEVNKDGKNAEDSFGDSSVNMEGETPENVELSPPGVAAMVELSLETNIEVTDTDESSQEQHKALVASLAEGPQEIIDMMEKGDRKIVIAISDEEETSPEQLCGQIPMEGENNKDKEDFSGAIAKTDGKANSSEKGDTFIAETSESRSITEEERETRTKEEDKAGLSEAGFSERNEEDGDMSVEVENEAKIDSDQETQDYELSLEDTEHKEEPVTLGAVFDTLLRAPGCCGPQESLSPSQSHIILFRPYNPSQPYPRAYRDKWDRDHVHMPCSPHNKYPAQDGEQRLESRWELICRAFTKQIATSYDLEEAILSYNAYHGKNVNFRLLHMLLLENFTQEEQKFFFEFTLPGIIRMALSLPDICTQSLPFLKQHQDHTITMTQQQAAALLACAFLCMFPRRNADFRRKKDDEFSFSFPSMNFAKLFQLDEHNRRPSIRKIEKLKCILHYFKKVLEQPPCGTLSFKRQVLKPEETPKWHNCPTRLCRLRVSSEGTIEDDADGLLQVDFANKLVGGGVLGAGCVQEEIRFAICPELIVSRLFTERLQDKECLIVTGAERFSDYTGYGDLFQWAGNHEDQTPRDSWGRRHTEIVAIDAKPRMSYAEQFFPANIKRELEKAFCGFFSKHFDPKHLPAVATGKWGCGAFGGDPQLKSMIQIMAASAARRDVLYFTFGDKEHARELYEIHSSLKDHDIAIGDLWRILNDFKKQLSSDTHLDLFGYIRQVLAPCGDK